MCRCICVLNTYVFCVPIMKFTFLLAFSSFCQIIHFAFRTFLSYFFLYIFVCLCSDILCAECCVCVYAAIWNALFENEHTHTHTMPMHMASISSCDRTCICICICKYYYTYLLGTHAVCFLLLLFSFVSFHFLVILGTYIIRIYCALGSLFSTQKSSQKNSRKVFAIHSSLCLFVLRLKQIYTRSLLHLTTCMTYIY